MKKYMFHRIALLFALLVISMPQMHAAEGSEEKSFDAKKVIFEHVLDNYGWEVPFSHSNRIPLPIIVRDKDGVCSDRTVSCGEKLITVIILRPMAIIKEKS